MQLAVRQTCSQALSLTGRGFGCTFTNRLSKPSEHVKVNEKLQHVRSTLRRTAFVHLPLSQRQHLRTLAIQPAGSWGLEGPAINLLRNSGNTDVLPLSAIPLELGLIAAKLRSTHRPSQNHSPDDATRLRMHQHFSIASLNTNRSLRQAPQAASMLSFTKKRKLNSGLATEIEAIDLTDSTSDIEMADLRDGVSHPKRQRIHSRHDPSITALTQFTDAKTRTRVVTTIKNCVELHLSTSTTQHDFSPTKPVSSNFTGSPHTLSLENDSDNDYDFPDHGTDLTVDDDDVNELLPDLRPQAARDFERALFQRNGRFLDYEFLQRARSPLGILVTPGKRVQLVPDANNRIHFLHIVHIFHDKDGIMVRGILLKRHRYVYPGKRSHSFLKRWQNDLCMDLKTTPEKRANPFDWESMVSVPLGDVEVERDIVFTNLEFNEISYLHRGLSVKIHGEEKVEEEGLLCVRWKCAQVVKDGKVVGIDPIPLEHKECDAGYDRPSLLKLHNYGRFTHLPHKQGKRADRKVTLGDGCAGGGLVSRAFVMAGGKVSWALDIDATCARTLKLNFPDAVILETAIQDFATRIGPNQDFTVDILHVSFPCQGHSPLNRGTNPERDMKNNETILSLAELLKHVRPRIVTLEQTDGIMHKNDGWWYSKLLSQLADAGYAISARKINMAEYGNTQARNRLMVYAACPGQKLPKWPQPSHGDGPGLLPTPTIRDCIQDIPFDAFLHNIEASKERYRRRPLLNMEVVDMDRPLQHLIDTQGAHILFRDESDGALYWPTFRQQMRLQGIPDNHRFVGETKTAQTTQNGNGVPCVFGKVFLEPAIQAIKDSDRELEAWNSEVLTID